VAKILEENGRAVGIRLVDGKEIRGDYIISAADLRATLYEMLDGKRRVRTQLKLLQGLDTCKNS